MKVTPEYNKDLLYRYDRPLPRYTSYPTAAQFQDGFSGAHWLAALTESVERNMPYSLYFHIPFCSSPCFYCGCNRIITRDYSRSQPYLEAMYRELALVADHIPVDHRIASQVHLGGGTPTFLSGDQIEELWLNITKHFTLQTEGEYSLEIDPRASSVALIERLQRIGFNRMSFGVQDLDPEAQKAVNRIQSAEETFEQIAAAKQCGIESVNVDLIYGLPKQTPASFAETIARVVAARPDRVAVYGYAHMPHLFKAQNQIDKYALPDRSQKLDLLKVAIDQFQDAGYEYIGLDHFALPDDELAKARRDNTLHRNFQGYSTQHECDMLGFGATSIGKIGNVCYQNSKPIDEYMQSISASSLPIVKGYTATVDDAVRGRAIMSLMCQGILRFDEFESYAGATFSAYFTDVIGELEAMEMDGLLELHTDQIRVTPMGQLLLRNICYVLDAYRKPAASTAKLPHSSAI